VLDMNIPLAILIARSPTRFASSLLSTTLHERASHRRIPLTNRQPTGNDPCCSCVVEDNSRTKEKLALVALPYDDTFPFDDRENEPQPPDNLRDSPAYQTNLIYPINLG
jgi:hypothetical protein